MDTPLPSSERRENPSMLKKLRHRISRRTEAASMSQAKRPTLRALAEKSVRLLTEAPATTRLFAPDLLDRLHSPLTRHPEC